MSFFDKLKGGIGVEETKKPKKEKKKLKIEKIKPELKPKPEPKLKPEPEKVELEPKPKKELKFLKIEPKKEEPKPEELVAKSAPAVVSKQPTVADITPNRLKSISSKPVLLKVVPKPEEKAASTSSFEDPIKSGKMSIE